MTLFRLVPRLRSSSVLLRRIAVLIQRGEWSTHGALVEASTGSIDGSQAVSREAMSNTLFPNPHRLLRNGQIAKGWKDSLGKGADHCRDLLQCERIRFDADGLAGASQLVDADELIARWIPDNANLPLPRFSNWPANGAGFTEGSEPAMRHGREHPCDASEGPSEWFEPRWRLRCHESEPRRVPPARSSVLACVTNNVLKQRRFRYQPRGSSERGNAQAEQKIVFLVPYLLELVPTRLPQRRELHLYPVSVDYAVGIALFALDDVETFGRRPPRD